MVKPGTMQVIHGWAAGVAHRDMIIVAVPERHLSDLAGVGAHELAHVLAYQLGRYEPPFKGEGFACYAAGLIGAQSMPMGLPVHFHPVWLQSVGVQVSLEALWRRADFSPELYDLAWSFAVFVAEHFGRERYFGFYRSREGGLPPRAEAALGVSARQLEQQWLAYARSCVSTEPARIARMHRYAGVVCGRAAWLHQHARASG